MIIDVFCGEEGDPKTDYIALHCIEFRREDAYIDFYRGDKKDLEEESSKMRSPYYLK